MMPFIPLQPPTSTSIPLPPRMSSSRSLLSSVPRFIVPAPCRRLPTISRAHSYFAPARRRCLYQTPRLHAHVKTFTTSPCRRLADVDDSFDPRQQDRESDEVDVCIVGGGNPLMPHPTYQLLMAYRTCRAQRCNPIKTTSK